MTDSARDFGIYRCKDCDHFIDGICKHGRFERTENDKICRYFSYFRYALLCKSLDDLAEAMVCKVGKDFYFTNWPCEPKKYKTWTEAYIAARVWLLSVN